MHRSSDWPPSTESLGSRPRIFRQLDGMQEPDRLIAALRPQHPHVIRQDT